MDGTNRYLISGLLIIASLIVVALVVPAKEIAVDLIGQIRSYGNTAPVVFFFIYLAAAMLGLSRSLVTIVAGIVFQPIVALMVVLVSSMTAFMATFFVSRYLVADWVSNRLENNPLAQKCISAVEDNGFRMLVMMRLNPFIPGFINGYGFGLTSINPLTYFAASLVGSLPLMLVYISLGWVSGKAVLYGGSDAKVLESGTLILGAVVSLVMLVVISWYARRSLKRPQR